MGPLNPKGRKTKRSQKQPKAIGINTLRHVPRRSIDDRRPSPAHAVALPITPPGADPGDRLNKNTKRTQEQPNAIGINVSRNPVLPPCTRLGLLKIRALHSRRERRPRRLDRALSHHARDEARKRAVSRRFFHMDVARRSLPGRLTRPLFSRQGTKLGTGVASVFCRGKHSSRRYQSRIVAIRWS